MRFLRIRPAVWAMISCSFSSFTLNVAFGSSSVTTPGNSSISSFAIRLLPNRSSRENGRARAQNQGRLRASCRRHPANETILCWHAKQAYDYPPDVRLHVYGDDWKWADADVERYRWREHEGRGYWRGGVWIGFYQ